MKAPLEAELARAAEALKGTEVAAALKRERLDVTLPGRRPALVGCTPRRWWSSRSSAFSTGSGFQVAEGPEAELDYYNFAALNIPEEHPARDMQDTFYISPARSVLRTHTSPNQCASWSKPAARCALWCPAAATAREPDATHEWMFYQVEGLAVDVGITHGRLESGTLTTFARRCSARTRGRFRCDYFPFVEPGVDIAISCHVCDGTDGCPSARAAAGWRSGRRDGASARPAQRWLRPGAGHRLRLGLGVERIAMIKYGIEDIRLFYANDLRFLEQFR